MIYEKLGWPVGCWYVPGWILFYLALSFVVLNKTYIEISELPDWEWKPRELRPSNHQNPVSPVPCCIGQRHSARLDPNSRKTDLTDEMSCNHLKSIQQKLCYVFASYFSRSQRLMSSVCSWKRDGVPAYSFYCPFISFRPPPCRQSTFPTSNSVLESDNFPFLLTRNKKGFLPVNKAACWLMVKGPSYPVQSCISHWNIRRIHLWFWMFLRLICRVSSNPSEHSVKCAVLVWWGLTPIRHSCCKLDMPVPVGWCQGVN